MLIRICLIVAIVGGLATASLSLIKVREKITTLQSELTSTRENLSRTESDLNNTRRELNTAKKDLDKTKEELASAQQERDTFLREVDEQRKRALTLADQLAKTTQERDDAQNVLQQWAVLGVNPDQVKTLIAQNKQLQNDRETVLRNLAELQRVHRTATNTLAKLLGGEDYRVSLPPDLRGRVVVVDPKYDFVVLDIGERQGALEDGVLLVNRNGKLVAKVQIRSVQPDRSIANILPGWKLGEVMEGDLVIPAI